MDSVNVTELKLENFTAKKSAIKGRINLTHVTQVKDTMYFFVKGLSVYAPTYVGVTARDKSKPLDVRLHKWNWHDVLRSGSTGDSGHWEDKFRTETDFGIMIISKDHPADYAITVWSGEDAKPDLPSPFSNTKTAAGDSGAGGAFLKNNWMYIVIGLLVIVIVFLFIKRKKSAA
jgi:LPXTG-motif cell wall-anchored protein